MLLWNRHNCSHCMNSERDECFYDRVISPWAKKTLPLASSTCSYIYLLVQCNFLFTNFKREYFQIIQEWSVCVWVCGQKDQPKAIHGNEYIISNLVLACYKKIALKNRTLDCSVSCSYFPARAAQSSRGCHLLQLERLLIAFMKAPTSITFFVCHLYSFRFACV